MKYRFDEAQVGALWINNSATASSGITHIYNDSTDNQKLKIGRSNILGNNVAMSIDREGTVSGSFTGSFGGDGSAITGVVAEWDGTHDGDASITGDLVLGGSTTVANETLAIESNAGDDQNIVLVWGDSTATGQPYLGLGILNDATASITAGARGTGETCLSVYTSPSTETERMRINSDGNVGIGVSDPQVQLDVVGSSADKSLQLRSGDSAAGTDAVQVIFSYNGKPYNDAGYAHSIRTRHHSGQAATNAIDFYLWTNTDSGDVLGTNRVMTLDGDGAIYAYELDSTAGTNYMRYHTTTGRITYIDSKKERKTNIKKLKKSDGIGVINQLRPVTFEMKNERGNTRTGFVVEEVAAVGTSLVSYGLDYKHHKTTGETLTGSDGKKVVKSDKLVPQMWEYEAVIAHLVKAVQQHNAIIEKLKQEIEKMKKN